MTLSSSSNEANAALVGANTVNGPAPLSVSTRPAATTASTRMLKSLMPWAICTTFLVCGRITLSITCTTPLRANRLVEITFAWRPWASMMRTIGPARRCTSKVMAWPCSVAGVAPSLILRADSFLRQHVVGEHLGQQRLVGEQLFGADVQFGQQRGKRGIGGREHA